MAREAANVYSTIANLPAVLESIPGTEGFFAFFSDKGPDNVINITRSDVEQIDVYGDPNPFRYGKKFREGQLCAREFNEISSECYNLRLLPDDAEYANILVKFDVDATTSLPIIVATNITGLVDEATINTAMLDSGNVLPISIFRARYRGGAYNDYAINLTPVANEDYYVLDIYKKNALGDKVSYRNYDVSFVEGSTDRAGDSLFITDVVDFYEPDVAVIVSDNIANVDSFVSGADVINFLSDEATVTPVANDRYIVSVGATGSVFAGHDNEVAEYNGSAWGFTVQPAGVVYNVTALNVKYHFSGLSWAEYDGIASAFTANALGGTDYKDLANGSEGSLLLASGKVNEVVAEQLLVNAYSGLVDPNIYTAVLNPFSVVFVPGSYPTSVKDAAASLVVNVRRDSIMLTATSDQPSVANAITERQSLAYNDYHIAMYNNWTKMQEKSTNSLMWLSPIFHVSRIIPFNDQVAALWAAPANFDRATLFGIRDIRYVPTDPQLNDLKKAQLNSVMRFPEGYTLWEMVTSQTKNNQFSDIPVVRLFLYVERVLKRFLRHYIFEDNNALTHSRISREISDYLRELQNNGALRGYSIDVGASDYDFKLKRAYVNITLYPVRAIEKIFLNLYAGE